MFDFSLQKMICLGFVFSHACHIKSWSRVRRCERAPQVEGGSFPSGWQKEKRIWKELRLAASKDVADGRKDVYCGSVARHCLTETVVTSGVLRCAFDCRELGQIGFAPSGTCCEDYWYVYTSADILNKTSKLPASKVPFISAFIFVLYYIQLIYRLHWH